VYFAALSANKGRELWRTDGTEAGTYLVKDIRHGGGDSDPDVLTAFDGQLFFTADDHIIGEELWRSDGTTGGTQLFTDLKAGSPSSHPDFLTIVEDKLYWIGYDGQSNHLFYTDGAAGNVVAVSGVPDIPFNLVNVLGDLYFVGSTGDGYHLWRTNGTECGTQKLNFVPGDDGANKILLVDGDMIFLPLIDVATGKKTLARYTVTPISTIEICNSLDDDCNGIIDDNALTATITPSGTFTACANELVTLNASPTGEDLTYAWYFNGNLVNGANDSFLSSTTLGGSLEVVISSTFGCTDTSEATTVNRIALPKAKITPQGDLDICTTGSVILKANAGSGYDYQWLLNNAPIPGATKKQYTATAEGNYKVQVTNADGCSKTSKKVEVVSSCKLHPGFSTTALTAYPNPFSDFTSLDLSKLNWPESEVEIHIMDLSGKMLFEKTFSSREEIEIGNELPDGFYLLRVIGNRHQQLISIVKNK
jgi:ELWxxDGT repeat protein